MKRYILILSIVAANCYAQNPEWINFTNGDKVFDILCSGNDIWIGTDGGLVKLDKTTDELAFYNRGNANLPDNHVRTLAMDSAGFLWIGTQYSGIGKFDGNRCEIFNTSNSYLPDDQLNTEVEIDPEGNLWVGSLGYILKFDGTEWERYEAGNRLSSNLTINEIIFDKEGTLWLGASWGLGKLIDDSIVVENYGGQNGPVYSIQVDTENAILVGIDRKGLFKFNGEEWIVYDTSNSGIPSNNIYDMKFDKNGNLWMATSGGLVKFDGSNWNVFNTSNSGIADNNVLSVDVDEQGIIWLGFFTDGLMRFDGSNWKKYDVSNSVLPSNAVHAINFDNNENTWLGTSRNTLIKYNGNNWVLYDASNSGVINTIFDIASDEAGNIWLGHSENPEFGNNYWLTKFDGSNWTSYDSTNSPFSKTWVYCLKLDINKNLWIGSSRGLIKFDGVDWTLYNMQNTPLTSNHVFDLEFDKNGNLWCGLETHVSYDNNGNATVRSGGLAKFDGNNWEVFNTGNSDLPYDNVTSVAIDSEGIIWLALNYPGIVGVEYGWGLTKFDGNSWTTYDIYNSPLTSNTIFDITIDVDDNLWLCTQSGGLLKYDRHDKWEVFNVRNSGIAFNSQNVISIDSYGNKWIGHNESGLSIFREDGVIITDVNAVPSIPGSFMLYQNYPNPFNPSTIIEFNLPFETETIISVYDILGRQIDILFQGLQKAGSHKILWDAKGFASGVYFCHIQTRQNVQTIKMLLIK